MNFSKKLFTGFTATAVGISLMAGGFSVLALEEVQNKIVTNTLADEQTGKVEETMPAAKEKVSETMPAAKENPTKKEYKTEAEITARINELKADSKYKEYAAAQEALESHINGAIKLLDGLKADTTGNIEIRNEQGKLVKTIGKTDVAAAKAKLEGLRKSTADADFKTLAGYENKLIEYFGKNSSIYNQAAAAKVAAAARNNKAKAAKAILDEIATLEAKLAALKKEANKSSDNKNSDSKKQETKAKETNKNQKSSNGTNNATATKKADATKIKTGVE